MQKKEKKQTSRERKEEADKIAKKVKLGKGQAAEQRNRGKQWKKMRRKDAKYYEITDTGR